MNVPKEMKGLLKKINNVCVGGALGIGLLVSGNEMKGQNTNGYVQRPLSGICYSPFTGTNQSPGGIYPSGEQMAQQIGVLKSFASFVRTYGSEGTLNLIPGICETNGIKCYPGVWISGDSASDDIQVNGMLSGISGRTNVEGIIVGNEFLLRGGDVSYLISRINSVRSLTGKKVGTAETWDVWQGKNSLANACDFLMIHDHIYWESPWWPDLSVTNGAEHIRGRIEYVKSLFPGKEVILGETGFPTQGPTVGKMVPGRENQKRLMQDLSDLLQDRRWFWFEWSDEDWKTNSGNFVENNWGAVYKNGNMKVGLSNLIGRDFKFFNGDKKSFELYTYPGNRYGIMSNTNCDSGTGWNTVTNVVGAEKTNRTRVNVDSGKRTREFLKAKIVY